jgi:hypothetical protein
MLKDKKTLLMFINSLLLPVTLMLYLYNQNARYLSLFQVTITVIVILLFIVVFFILLQKLYQSEQTAFSGCVVALILLFLYNDFHYNYLKDKAYGHVAILLIPIIGYMMAYLFNILLNKKKLKDLPEFIAIVLTVVLVINLFNFGKILFYPKGVLTEYEYKTKFVTEAGLATPNVYWILCDGLLGFDAMEKYFDNRQEELTTKLETRGFNINKSAMFEAGHSTRIAVPLLMCPEYLDKYMKNILVDHEAAMRLFESPGAEMFNARYHNETINAFASKGYTTITMALDDDMFFPVTDFFYYVTAHYILERNYKDLPYYTKLSEIKDPKYLESRVQAMHLGDLFLAGIPDNVFDALNKKNVIRYPLTVNTDIVKNIVPNKPYAELYSVLIESLYDSLYSKEISVPRFTLLHAYMSHFPICFDEDGNLLNKVDNILSYPGHHAFATDTLLKMVDLILEADPDAVIVLQADHGLHGQEEKEITKAFSSPGSAIEIWNSVFSAVRVPEKYKNGEEVYATENPLNISRYLVNNYVGKNYEYITDS